MTKTQETKRAKSVSHLIDRDLKIYQLQTVSARQRQKIVNFCRFLSCLTKNNLI